MDDSALFPSMSDYPKTRREAREQGSRYYHTGKPCVNGHDSKRITGSGHCQGCNVMHTYKRLENNPEYKRKFNERNLARHHESKSDESYVAKRRAYGREYAQRPEVVERVKAQAKIRSQKKEVIFRRRERENLWRAANPSASREKVMKRHRLKILATPFWTTRGDLNQIQAVYTRATALTRKTGVPHHVDHIVPLQHPRVCGLHVLWNLQILTEHENISKGNAFDEDAAYDPRSVGRCQG